MASAMEIRGAAALFPMFVKLEGKPCLVVGAGRNAEAKIESLLRSGARVVVIAPRATRRIAQWARAGKIQWRRRRFLPRDIHGAAVVISATSRAGVNEAVFSAARRAGIFCNAVDDPGNCDFYYPAVLRRGSLQIAISTGGCSPALAQRLRIDLESRFPAEYGEWVAILRRLRGELRARSLSTARRRNLLHRQASSRAFQAFLRTRNSWRAGEQR